MQHRGYNDLPGTYGNAAAQKYKYNGKEYNDAFGLNIYEMDWRQYDPAISRWTVMDSVTHHDFSPYSVFDNNPAFWSDPSGANSVKYNWKSGGYDVLDKDGKVVGSFDPDMLGNYLPVIAESINLFFSLNPNDDENSGGNGGGKKNKGANNKGIGTRNWQFGILGMSGKTFFGAPIRLIPYDFGASSYFGGAINVYIGNWIEYLEKGLNSRTGLHLMHEYGHYLQDKYMGIKNYYSQVIPSSVKSYQTDFPERDWSEIQASTLAWIYFNKPEGFTEDKNVINFGSISTYSPDPIPYQVIQILQRQYVNHPDYKP